MSRGSSRSQGGECRQDREQETNAADPRRVIVAQPPEIKGPYPVEGSPILVEYEVVARLFLPSPDTEVVPSVCFTEEPEDAKYLDVQWITSDEREPRGVWERSAVITLPRQFRIESYSVTGDVPLREREAAA